MKRNLLFLALIILLHSNAVGGKRALSISLISFEACSSESAVTLRWTCASQVNNSHFLVERTKDGINYERIDSVTGAGSSFAVLSYSSVDPEPYAGVSYYRLKQVDVDGEYKELKIVAVEFKESGNFQLNAFPNPCSETLNITFSGINAEEQLVLKLYDTRGNVVLSRNIYPALAAERLALDLGNLPAGTYFISATGRKDQSRQKIIIN